MIALRIAAALTMVLLIAVALATLATMVFGDYGVLVSTPVTVLCGSFIGVALGPWITTGKWKS